MCASAGLLRVSCVGCRSWVRIICQLSQPAVEINADRGVGGGNGPPRAIEGRGGRCKTWGQTCSAARGAAWQPVVD